MWLRGAFRHSTCWIHPGSKKDLPSPIVELTINYWCRLDLNTCYTLTCHVCNNVHLITIVVALDRLCALQIPASLDIWAWQNGSRCRILVHTTCRHCRIAMLDLLFLVLLGQMLYPWNSAGGMRVGGGPSVGSKRSSASCSMLWGQNLHQSALGWPVCHNRFCTCPGQPTCTRAYSIRRPKSIHQCCARGPPPTPWRLFGVYVFSFFFPWKQALWYTPNLFLPVEALEFSELKTLWVYTFFPPINMMQKRKLFKSKFGNTGDMNICTTTIANLFLTMTLRSQRISMVDLVR